MAAKVDFVVQEPYKWPGALLCYRSKLSNWKRDPSPRVLLATICALTGGIRHIVQPENMKDGEWDEILGKRHALVNKIKEE